MEQACNSCNRIYTDPKELEFLELAGECFACDHVRGEIYAEQLTEREYDEEQYEQ